MVAQLQSLDGLSAVQLRELTVRLAAEVKHKQALIDKLTNENALLKRMKFAAQSERFSAEQFSLLDGLDIEDLACESEAPPHPPRSFVPSCNRSGNTCHRACRAERSCTIRNRQCVNAVAR